MARSSPLVAILALCVAAPVFAQEGPPGESAPDEGLELSGLLYADVVAGLNPRGLSFLLGGQWRMTYGRDPENILFDDLYLQAQTSLEPNPAWTQAAFMLEAVPLAPIRVRFRYDVYGFYGSKGALLSFPSKDARFGRKERDRLDGEEEAGIGHRVWIQPTLRLKLGPVLVRSQTEVAWYFLPGKGPYLLELEYDTLLKDDSDGLVAHRTHVLFELWKGEGDAFLHLGPQYEVVHSFGAELTRQRVGAFLYYVPVDELWGLDRLHFWLWAGVTFEDRNRDDEGFVMGGIGFDLDL